MPDVEKKALELLKNPDGGAEACAKFLTGYTGDFARAARQKYAELTETFWGLFARGF